MYIVTNGVGRIVKLISEKCIWRVTCEKSMLFGLRNGFQNIQVDPLGSPQ